MTAPGKLVVGAAVVAGVSGYMAYLGAQSSWQYYLTIDECVARAGTASTNRIRVSGRVAADSLRIASDRSRADLVLDGFESHLTVVCSGPLPDNLAEGIDVVVEGHLGQAGVFQADKVLTRCASKYEERR